MQNLRIYSNNLIWIMPAKGREKKGFGSCSRSLFFCFKQPEAPRLFLKIPDQKNILSGANKKVFQTLASPTTISGHGWQLYQACSFPFGIYYNDPLPITQVQIPVSIAFNSITIFLADYSFLCQVFYIKLQHKSFKGFV